MSILRNLGFGSRDTGPAYQPSAGMYSMMGADAPYESGTEDEELYSMLGASGGGGSNALLDYLQKLGKKKGKKGDPTAIDISQGMGQVHPFSIIGRPGLLGR